MLTINDREFMVKGAVLAMIADIRQHTQLGDLKLELDFP